MKVEIWSDVMCPFCYIGKRKFEKALSEFENRSEVEIVWKSFQLNPAMKTEAGKNINQYLAEIKGWSFQQAKEMNDRVSAMAKEVGLNYNFDKAIVANSFDAHRFIQFAKKKNKGDQAEEHLFKAYFIEGKNTADHSILLQLGKEIGLDENELKTMLASDDYAKDVHHDMDEAQQIGIRGVPFFVFDRKFAVSGAQASDVFLETLKKAGKGKTESFSFQGNDLKLKVSRIIQDRAMTKELLKDIIQWDVKSWSKALTYWDKNIDWDKIQNGLELGGRQGGLSLWLALKGKAIICSDLNDVKKTAEQLHSRHNISSLIIYQDIDATNIPHENYFDIIVFKSIIGGIGINDNYEMQQKVFKEIYKALKPGGKLLFAENLIASPFHQRLRKRFIDWGNAWRYVSIKEMKEFLKMFSSYDIQTTGVLGTFGRNESQRNFLSTIDKTILNAICPDNWKYIVYGIAEK